ncbi:MAG: hypothetical protein DMG83_21080 [Acidobacteria bacterium]|nr:MAG: hypothetical protein DMG83_21080 [Acidobacteriota bacterium]
MAIGWNEPAIWGRVLRRRIMRRVLGSIFVLTLLVAAGYSQTFRGAINGTVSDPSGAMVSGANVKATNVATGVTLTTTTTSDGQFAFQAASTLLRLRTCPSPQGQFIRYL